jgi:hypothetical protein
MWSGALPEQPKGIPETRRPATPMNFMALSLRNCSARWLWDIHGKGIWRIDATVKPHGRVHAALGMDASRPAADKVNSCLPTNFYFISSPDPYSSGMQSRG